MREMAFAKTLVRRRPAYPARMDWEDLHYAVEVARAGSAAAAARALGVAQSTVYRRVTALEERTGAKLFDRRGGAYVLTEAGKDLLAEGLDVSARISALTLRLASRTRGVEGEVRVAAPELLAVELTRLLASLRAELPRIRVHLVVGREPAALDQREADIALRVTASPAGSLIGRKLGDVAFAVYGATSYAPACGGDLAGLDWVCFDASLTTAALRQWEAERVPAERVALRTNSRAAFLQAIVAGAGVGVLPCGVASRIPTLVARSGVIPELTLPLWLLTHPEVAKVPRVRTVLDFLGAAIGRERAVLEGSALAAG